MPCESPLVRRSRGLFRTVIALLLLTAGGSSWSQPSLRLLASYRTDLAQDASVAASIGFDGAFVGPIRVAGDAVLGADPGADLRARGTITFGPLGLVLIETLAGVRVAGDPAAAASLRAQGNLGPVAAQLYLSARSADHSRFSSLLDEPPALGGRAWGASLRLSGRISGTWIAEALVERQRSNDADLTRVHLDARARRGVTEGVDPVMYGRVTELDALQVWGIGGGVILTERRSPELSFRTGVEAWLDGGFLHVAPAFGVAGARSTPPGLLSWDVTYQPLAVENELSAALRLRTGASDGVVWTLGLDGHARSLRTIGEPMGFGISVEVEVP